MRLRQLNEVLLYQKITTVSFIIIILIRTEVFFFFFGFQVLGRIEMHLSPMQGNGGVVNLF